jgi:hypothetical protein
VQAEAVNATTIKVLNPDPLLEYRVEEVELDSDGIVVKRTERASWTPVSS